MIAAAAVFLTVVKCGSSEAAVKQEVKVTNEVTRVGPYSQMIRAGGFLYCSGQVAFDPATGKITGDNVTAQTKQIFTNLENQMKDAGNSLDHAVKVTVYLKNMEDFAAMNEEYAKHFNKPYPVRTCVEIVKIPVENALIMIDMTCLDSAE